MAQTTRTTSPGAGSLDGLLPTISSGAAPPKWLSQQLIEHCPFGIAIARGENHVVECVNDAFARLTRQARERLVDRPLTDSLFWINRSAVAMLDCAYDREHSETAVDQARAVSGGAARTLRCSAWPFADPSDRRRGLVVMIEDVTEAVFAEEQLEHRSNDLRSVNERLVLATLREHESAEQAKHDAARLEALLANLSDGVIILDPSGRIHLVNTAVRKILGTAVNACEDAVDLRRIELRDASGVTLSDDERPASRALRGERFENEEIEVVRARGDVRHIVASGTNVANEDGSIALAMVVFRDVTELRRLERVREEYTSLVSHDLRGPLSAVLSFASLLQRVLEDTGRADDAHSARRIVENARHMDSMIADLLDANRMNGHPGELRLARCDLGKLVTALVERMDNALRVRVDIESDGTKLPVLADPDRLERAVGNILANALKYSPPDRPIRVRLQRTDRDVQLDVIDRGVGIPPEDLTRVFERYYRSSTGRSQRGLGLGLYIASLIVQEHGGRLWVRSAVSEGSTFSVAIPAAP